MIKDSYPILLYKFQRDGWSYENHPLNTTSYTHKTEEDADKRLKEENSGITDSWTE